jgi:hypothetical protein
MMIGEDIGKPLNEMPRDAYYNDRDLPTFNAYLVIIVKDEDGKVINVHRQRSHSPTSNFIRLLLPYTWYSITGQQITVTNINGSSNSWAPYRGQVSYPNTANNAPSYVLMIQVGTGTQSNLSSVTHLAAPVGNGSGPGELIYGTPAVSTNITASGSSAYFYVSQSVINNSGASITITEIGLVTQIWVNGPGCGYSVNFGPVLMWYDVLSSAITIPNGGSAVIYYFFTVNP